MKNVLLKRREIKVKTSNQWKFHVMFFESVSSSWKMTRNLSNFLEPPCDVISWYPWDEFENVKNVCNLREIQIFMWKLLLHFFHRCQTWRNYISLFSFSSFPFSCLTYEFTTAWYISHIAPLPCQSQKQKKWTFFTSYSWLLIVQWRSCCWTQSKGVFNTCLKFLQAFSIQYCVLCVLCGFKILNELMATTFPVENLHFFFVCDSV